MRSKVLLLVIALICSGCMQSKEHLVVKEDGSGTLEVDLFIPQGTVQLIDTMLGGMVKVMSEAFGAAEGQPTSVTEQMFGSPKEILKKAKEAGVTAEILEFNKEKKDDGLYVDYILKYDNIDKLLQSKIVSSNFEIQKNAQGNWICRLKRDPSKVQESKAQLGQVEGFQESEDFKNMDPAMQAMMMEGLSNLKIESLVTLPNEIIEIEGLFEKVDAHTARIAFSGNFLEDESLLEKMYGMAGENSYVVWATGIDADVLYTQGGPKVLTLKQQRTKSPKEDSKEDSAKVYLKSGSVIEGTIVEKTEDFVKVDFYGVIVTYYNDEIDRIE